MTPEEKAVLDLAIEWGHAVPGSHERSHIGRFLESAIKALIYSRAPSDCACDPTKRMYCAAINCHGGAEIKEWRPAALRFVLAGDRIRIGTDETIVTASSLGVWHADNMDPWRPVAWTHEELRLDLEANPGLKQYPANTPCDILCDAARAAALLLQTELEAELIGVRPGKVCEIPACGCSGEAHP